MSNGEDQTGATANWRKYPKGPNFGLIVGLSCVTLLVILFGAWLVFRMNPRMVPNAHGPQPASKSLSTPAKDGR